MRLNQRSGVIVQAAVWLGVLLAVLIALPASAQQDLDQEKLNLGGRIYTENCAVCHGENGEGRVGATLAKDWPSIRPDLTVETIIVNGVPGSVMPAWSQAKGGPLTDAEIDALVYYILSWQTGGPPEIDLGPSPTARPTIQPPANVQGDPNKGAVLYDQNCAVCHGDNGEGRVGATLAKVWSGIRPDLNLKTNISNGVMGSVMPAWSSEKGGPLSEEQIEDIVSFVMSWGESGQVVNVETPTQTPTAIELGSSWVLWLGLLLILGAAGLYLAFQKK